jgi:hypothetical protein
VSAFFKVIDSNYHFLFWLDPIDLYFVALDFAHQQTIESNFTFHFSISYLVFQAPI